MKVLKVLIVRTSETIFFMVVHNFYEAVPYRTKLISENTDNILWNNNHINNEDLFFVHKDNAK